MQKTPSKASQKIDAVIDRLNSRWDLQIPRLHGLEAKKAGHDEELSRKCSSRIRALCWKGNVNIDGIVEDFEERAARKHSEWIYKRSQEGGTIPNLPVTKSFLKRDAMSKSRISPHNRLILVTLLAELLEDEYKLAKESGSYERTPSFTKPHVSGDTSFTSFTSTRSASTSVFATPPEHNASSIANAFAKPPDAETRIKPSKALTNSKPIERQTPVKSRSTSTVPAADQCPEPSLSMARKSSRQAAQPASNKKRGAVEPKLEPTSKKTKVEPVIAEREQLTLSQTFRRRSNRFSGPTARDSSLGSSRYSASRHLNDNNLVRSFDTVMSENADQIFSDGEDGAPSSNDTSILSETMGGRESHFSGGTQLDRDVTEDVTWNRSFRSADNASQQLKTMLDSLPTAGPFRFARRQLPENLPYWFTIELYRVSLHLDCDVGVLFHKVHQACNVEVPSYSRFWKEVQVICCSQHIAIPPRSNISSWIHEDNMYYDPATTRSVSLSARLDFSATPEKQMFDFKLNPLQIDKSCRIHRKMGADRFMVLDIPCFAPEYHLHTPQKLKDAFKPEQIHDRVWDWIGLNDLYIAGRTWRAFWVESKDVPKKKRKQEGSRMKVHLFAVSGWDFAGPEASITDTRYRPISLRDLIQWHIPIESNIHSTDMKLFARMHLGLSRTTPTVVLKPSEFIHVIDRKPIDSEGVIIENGEIMTDGCARMSYDLAVAVWKQIGKSNENVPTAFQARIAGAKGLWIVDYNKNHPEVSERDFWIEISDSQLKIKPHPTERLDADDFQRTFEVVKTSRPCSSTNLNIQLINVLEHQGVPRERLATLMLAELTNYYESMSTAMVDPAELRRWRQTWHPTRSAQLEMGWAGEMPDAKEDELDILLESGFHPQHCEYMVKECLKRIISQSLDDRQEKLWIRIPHSTNVFCVPDPLSVLEPGEIQFNSSQAVADFPEWELENKKVLVTRNPAHLASDIQAAKLVFRPELRHLKDVAIFPVKDSFPLAGKLSGGDYDGDTVTMIWDETITASFQNSSVPSLPDKDKCGITTETQFIKEAFTVSRPTVQEVDQFMRKCCGFNAESSRLGEVTKLLEKLVYANLSNMTSDDALVLAALAGYLVDGAKAGDRLKTKEWRSLYSRIWNKYHLLKLAANPAYDDDDAITSSRKDPRTRLCLNILDYLKFDVAIGQSNKILTDFEEQFNPTSARDADLKQLYDNAWAMANRSKGSQRDALKKLLTDLKDQVKEVNSEWERRLAKNTELRNRKALPKDAILEDYAKLLDELSEKLKSIEPCKTDCHIYHDFTREGGGPGSAWSRMRASCVYFEHYRSKMPWKLVGDELCFIKGLATRQQGVRARIVVQPVRDYMKMDIKKQRRVIVSFDDKEDAAIAESEML